MRLPVMILLLANIAGTTTDPQALATAAQCLECGIPPGMQGPVIISLLCQIANK